MANEEIDFIDVTKTSYLQEHLNDLRLKQQEYTVKHEPFDFRNAYLELQDYIADFSKNVDRARSTKGDMPKAKTKWNWDAYGDPKRFELVATVPVREVNTKLGMLTPTLTGVNKEYVVVGKGNRITVFVPNTAEDLKKK